MLVSLSNKFNFLQRHSNIFFVQLFTLPIKACAHKVYIRKQMDSVSLSMKTLFTGLDISHSDLISGTHPSPHLQRTALICGGRLWLQSLVMSQTRRDHLRTGNETCYIDQLFIFILISAKVCFKSKN